jgi:hypothetical protein
MMLSETIDLARWCRKSSSVITEMSTSSVPPVTAKFETVFSKATQHQDEINHGCDEDAERHLRLPVAHEAADESGPELLRRERENDHGDRDCDGRHVDHGAPCR